MKRYLFVGSLILCAALVFIGCGGDSGKADKPGTVKKEAPAEPQGESEGTAVAKEILETFDKAVKEAAELVKDKPAGADVKPKLEALYKKYEELMTALNAKYLELKTKDIALFGEANGYMGENRGKHVFNKDNILGEYIAHYTREGETDVVQMISKDLVKLIDVAVKH